MQKCSVVHRWFLLLLSSAGWSLWECVQNPSRQWQDCVCVWIQDDKGSHSDTGGELCGSTIQFSFWQVLLRNLRYKNLSLSLPDAVSAVMSSSWAINSYCLCMLVHRWSVHEQWWNVEETAAVRLIYFTKFWPRQKHHGAEHLWGDPIPARGDREGER